MAREETEGLAGVGVGERRREALRVEGLRVVLVPGHDVDEQFDGSVQLLDEFRFRRQETHHAGLQEPLRLLVVGVAHEHRRIQDERFDMFRREKRDFHRHRTAHGVAVEDEALAVVEVGDHLRDDVRRSHIVDAFGLAGRVPERRHIDAIHGVTFRVQLFDEFIVEHGVHPEPVEEEELPLLFAGGFVDAVVHRVVSADPVLRILERLHFGAFLRGFLERSQFDDRFRSGFFRGSFSKHLTCLLQRARYITSLLYMYKCQMNSNFFRNVLRSIPAGTAARTPRYGQGTPAPASRWWRWPTRGCR